MIDQACAGGTWRRPNIGAPAQIDDAVQRRFVDGADVLTRFDLHTSGAPPCPTVKWSHVKDGKITANRVTFDPRPLTEGDAGAGPPAS